jgi:hypothetical protein
LWEERWIFVSRSSAAAEDEAKELLAMVTLVEERVFA